MGTVTQADALTFGGNAVVTGAVGAAGSPVNSIHANGGAAAAVELQGDVYADHLNFGDDGLVQLGGTAHLGDVASAHSNSGTLAFAGDATVANDVGAVGAVLKALNANGGPATLVDLQGNVYAGALNFGGDGKVDFLNSGGAKLFGVGSVTTGADGTGTLTLSGLSARKWTPTRMPR